MILDKKTIKSLTAELNSGRINDEDCCTLAEMLFAQPDCDRARPYSVLEKGAKRKFPKAMANLAWYYLKDGKPGADSETDIIADAVELLTRALPFISSANQARANASLGAALIRKMKYPEADKALRAIPEAQRDASVMNNLGVTAFYLGKQDEAAEWFVKAKKKAAEGSSEKSLAAYNYAAALLAGGNTEAAAAAAEETEALGECDAVDMYDIARIYYNLRNYEKVCSIIPQSKSDVIPNPCDFAVYACSLYETGRSVELDSYYAEASSYYKARRKEALYDATEKKYEQLLNELKTLYAAVSKGTKPDAAAEVRSFVGRYRY